MFLSKIENLYLLILRVVIAIGVGVLLVGVIAYCTVAGDTYLKRQTLEKSRIELGKSKNSQGEGPEAINSFQTIAENPIADKPVADDLLYVINKDMESFWQSAHNTLVAINPKNKFSYNAEFKSEWFGNFLDQFESPLEKKVAAASLLVAMNKYKASWQDRKSRLSARDGFQARDGFPIPGGISGIFFGSGNSVEYKGSSVVVNPDSVDLKNAFLYLESAPNGTDATILEAAIGARCSAKTTNLDMFVKDGAGNFSKSCGFSPDEESKIWRYLPTSSSDVCNIDSNAVEKASDDLWGVFSMMCPGTKEHFIITQRLQTDIDRIKADYAAYQQALKNRDIELGLLSSKIASNLLHAGWLGAAFLLLVFMTIIVMIERNLRMISLKVANYADDASHLERAQ